MSDQQWHLDKRVPVAIIFAILMQSLGGVWWASSLNERTAQIERRLDGFADRSQSSDRDISSLQQSVAVLSTQIDNTLRSVSRLENEVAATNTLLREYLESQRPYRGGRSND